MPERQFQTDTVRFGAGGLNLRPQNDVVPRNQVTRLRNAVRLATGSFTSRPGETQIIASGGTTVHSIGRLNNAFADTFLRVLGIDQDLAYGNGPGAPTTAESGFSGNPLTMIGADPPITGDPWMYVADSVKMRKIRSDGLDFEIGLPKGVLISTVAQTLTFRTDIDDFEAADYNLYAGDGGGDPPTQALVAGMVGNAVQFTTVPGAAAAEYSSLADKAFAANLDEFTTSGVTVQGTANDLIHLWAKTDGPDFGALIIYFITGAFNSGDLPGTGTNTEYFAFSLQAMTPTVWKEFNIRRGDFAATAGADWADVQGIAIVMGVDTAAGVAVNVLDDWYITPSNTGGGAAEPPYDWRVTNYDPRTGVEGNPSDIQPESSWLDSLQSVVTITPAPYGDAAIRQRAYRRGNTLPGNWYLVGENLADGGVINDANSDLALENALTVQIDHDQPITTQNAAGETLLNQPIPIIFGPVNGLFFGLGNPREPGTFYWTLPDRIDYWPATYKQQACAASEILQTGCVWGGEGYCASNGRWFRLLPDLNNAQNVTSQPTGATKGPVARWAMCVGPDGVYFVGDDGLYRHTGGPQENLTDQEMYPLFNGQTKNGVPPIDFSALTNLRLGTVLNEVWMQYQDTDGAINHLVWNALTREWRIVTFQVPTGVAVGELEDPQNPPKLLLLGGLLTGAVYSHTGTSDDGQAIPCNVRTPALDQQFQRNPKQYGDVIVKYNPGVINIDVTAYLDDETTALAPITLPVGAQQLVSINPFGGVPTPGRNIALDFVWDSTGAPPVLDLCGVSFFVEPDITQTRISDWDDGGAPGEKYFKGCVIDCDTLGLDKEIVVEGTLYDGAVATLATLTVNANGRRKLTLTWPRQAVTLVRIRPTDADTWQRWAWQWIFDEEPLALDRWETEPLALGLAGWKMIPEMWLALRSAAAVTLTVTGFYDDGTTSVAEVYVIPSTAGAKRSFRLPLRAGKGVLYTFLFTSNDGSRFRLYREETHVFVKPIAAADLQVRHPFGNDDLDLVRGIQSAEGTALAPGGGQG